MTRGSDLDPDGYSLVFEAVREEHEASSVREEHIGVNDSLLISEEDLPPGGVWTVRLNGVPDNCFVRPGASHIQAIVESNPLRLRLPGEATVRLTFTVDCIQRSSRIAFQSGGGVGGDILLTTSGGDFGPVNLTKHPAADVSPALSPDRSRIVFSSNRDDPNGFYHLYAVNADGSGLVQLTSSPGYDWVGPQAWSPDGSRIVFISTRDGNDEIYIMNADGSGVVRLTRNAASDITPAWSPDGSEIAFASNRGAMDGVFDIYRMRVSDGLGIVRVASNGYGPAWSPDGSKIAYVWGSDPWGYDVLPDLAVIGVSGGRFVQLRPDLTSTENPQSPSWSPDGTTIVYSRGWDVSQEVMIVPFDGNGFGKVVKLIDGASPSWR